MDVGSLLSVADTASELGVSAQKVRAFIGEGRLPAIKVGSGWRVSVVDVARFSQIERRAGRPTPPADAWRLLLDAETSGRLHLRRSHGVDAFGLAHLVRRRATVHRLHVLDRLAHDVSALLVAGGESAARTHGFAPHSAGHSCDGYIRRSEVKAIESRFALVPAIGDDINLWLRAVDDDNWPFGENTVAVGPLVAAVDMVNEPIDDRSVEAALPVIEKYL